MRPHILSDIDPSWEPILLPLINLPELVELRYNVLPNIIKYPENENIFRVFSLPLNRINVVIMGQDPYHGREQATGLAFAVEGHIPSPPSLNVIYKEVATSVGLMRENYEVTEVPVGWKTLEHWHEQGVFLLNSALTVEQGLPESHLKYWHNFTAHIVRAISHHNPCLWFFWGKKSAAFMPYLRNKVLEASNYNEENIKQIPMYKDCNYIFRAAHPAAEAYRPNAGFYGCNHFKLANEVLAKQKRITINW